VILEVAILNVRLGMAPAFEAAFSRASSLISRIPGYRFHNLRRCIEVANRYILLVEWDSLEAHTIGFRRSSEYQQWKALLHHFYDPFPTVEHYASLSPSVAAPE